MHPTSSPMRGRVTKAWIIVCRGCGEEFLTYTHSSPQQMEQLVAIANARNQGWVTRRWAWYCSALCGGEPAR